MNSQLSVLSAVLSLSQQVWRAANSNETNQARPRKNSHFPNLSGQVLALGS